jgi:glycosyltransferase involved in cell wall biosynthesis
MAKSNTLVCIPCYDSEDTIEDMVELLLANSDADILLVDDGSKVPLESFIPDRFANQMDRVEIVRPNDKVFSGGGKNLGIWKAIEEDYAYLILLDSDLELPARFVSSLRNYLEQYPNQVLVAPSIKPAGNRWQYADTMINFSSYLPSPDRKMSPKNCLAGYAFALNMRVYRQNPVFHRGRYGGEDVLYFHDVMERFELDYLPMLNDIAVRHLPPRVTREDAKNAQQRYGKAFFSHNDGSRERLFSSLPWMHFVTPRFILMVGHFPGCTL